MRLWTICILAMGLTILTGCQDDNYSQEYGGGGGFGGPAVTFSMKPPSTGDYAIYVHDLWPDHVVAIPNPYPMDQGLLMITRYGEMHTFRFTYMNYHADHGLQAFSVVVDSTWTCRYHLPGY